MAMYTGYTEIASVTATERFVAAEEQRHLLEHAPLVRRVVRQLSAQAGGAMDREDMMQIGLMGLLEALRRYGEPDERFGAYATLRVRGAILDELRRQDWRPRTVRQESHRVRDGVRQLTRQLGREPSEAEIIGALQISVDDYIEYQQATNSEQMASFDEMLQDGVQHIGAHHSPEAEWIARRSIEQALTALSEREQRVVQLYYEFELSLKEIAAVLELTEARVCQINKSALQKMKAVLQPH
jgi:RNA polymerase sigma factor FliA